MRRFATRSRNCPSASRGREACFQAARELLAEQGSDAVTVAALCRRLGLSKGSCHHHFTTLPGFVTALAEHREGAYGVLLAGDDRCSGSFG
jgi:AcrR family transcriptional regulator